MIEVESLNKSYGSNRVLIDFDIGIEEGEVHALLGSNGAGKSTLARILTGLTPFESGTIRLRGKTYRPRSRREASGNGIVMVFQELNVIPTLTVAENLFFDRLPNRAGWIDRRQLNSAATEALARVGLGELDPETPASHLGVGQQQLIEIAGALTQKARLLILDEPTSALTGPEIDSLFENIERLRAGGVAIIYISHRMEEIARISDRVTVLRDGKRISTHHSKRVESPQLIREMSGSEIAERKGAAAVDRGADVGLAVCALSAGPLVRDISFEVRRGEIVGIAGLIGAGRTETLRAIFGADPIESGEVSGARPTSPAVSVRRGIALIPEDRKEDGLLLDKSIESNMTLSVLGQFSTGGWMNRGKLNAASQEAGERLHLKHDGVDRVVSELSGGNQQKVVIARWLLRDSKVFLFDEPTRGVDVAAKEAIYELLDELAARGKTIVVVSSDFLELMKISHRILVMSNGRITGEFEQEEWSQEKLTEAAFAGFSNPGLS